MIFETALVEKYQTKELDALMQRIFPEELPLQESDWQEPGTISFFILAEGKRIGFVTIQENREPATSYEADPPFAPGFAYLLFIGILPDYQKKGFGTAAMHWLMSWAKSKNLNQIVSNIRPSNIASERLHDAIGFKELVIYKDYYPEPNREDTSIRIYHLY